MATPKIIDYTFAHSEQNDEGEVTALNQAVKRLMRQGWQPFGSIIQSGGDYFQPMVKYAPEETPTAVAVALKKYVETRPQVIIQAPPAFERARLISYKLD